MRALSIAGCVLLPFLLFAGEPRIDTHLSSDSVREIIRLVRTDTKVPVASIDCLPADRPGPNTFPVQCDDASKEPMQPKTCYNRTDLVLVLTSDGKQLPMGYTVQKLRGGWKILRKKRFVD